MSPVETLPSPAPAPRRRPRVIARKLSEEMRLLQERSKTEEITVRTVIVALGVRAYSLLLILLALPFITPIPLPGLSTPFGLAIALIALRLTLGQRPWLAKTFQRRVLPTKFFDQLMRFAGKIIAGFEKLLKPRLAILTEYGWQRQIHASLMLVSGLALLLPVPIPFTNSFPAWVVLLMAAGLLERDGLFVTAAYAMFTAGIFYIILLGEAATKLMEKISQWLTG
jgi:hypothetical protein